MADMVETNNVVIQEFSKDAVLDMVLHLTNEEVNSFVDLPNRANLRLEFAVRKACAESFAWCEEHNGTVEIVNRIDAPQLLSIGFRNENLPICRYTFKDKDTTLMFKLIFAGLL